jgi:hypothetical protein
MNKKQIETKSTFKNTTKPIATFDENFDFNEDLLKELIIDFQNGNKKVSNEPEKIQKYFYEFLICYEDLPFRYDTSTNDMIWDTNKKSKENISEGFERFLNKKIKFKKIYKLNKNMKIEELNNLKGFIKNKFITILNYIKKDFNLILKEEQKENKNNDFNNIYEDSNRLSEDSMDIKERFYKSYLNPKQYENIESYFKYNKYIINGLIFDSQIEAQTYLTFLLPFELFKIPNREDLNIFTGTHVLYKKLTNFNNGNKLDFINKKLKFVLEVSSYIEDKGAYNDHNHGKKYYFNDEMKSIQIDIYNTLSELLKTQYNFDLMILTDKGHINYASIKTVSFDNFKSEIFKRLNNYINNSNFNENDIKSLKEMQLKYEKYVENSLKNPKILKKYNPKLHHNNSKHLEKSSTSPEINGSKEKDMKIKNEENIKDVLIEKEHIEKNIPSNIYIKFKLIEAKIRILKLELSNNKKSGVFNNKNGLREYTIKRNMLLEFESYLKSDFFIDKLISHQEVNNDMNKNKEMIEKYMKQLIIQIENEMNNMLKEFQIKYKTYFNSDNISKYFDKIISNMNFNHFFHLEINKNMENGEKEKIEEYNKLFEYLKNKMIKELKDRIIGKIEKPVTNLENQEELDF